VSPLADLRELRSLGFNRTGVTDLSPLKDLHDLQKLAFAETGVTDLSPLAGLSALQGIDAYGCGLRVPIPFLRDLVNRPSLKQLVANEVAGVPPEALSHHFTSGCLRQLRAYLAEV
jgi:internalin A